ncbi:MAG: response regulator [Candidatus Omnitrophica bacterium]|nr:response regulator [Candidatus Omnitrophota bacterium]
MLKVLVIDDEPGVLNLLQKRLEANGYAVVTAVDGIDGMRKMRAELPDLAILDVMMPEMDGFSLLKEIRSVEALKGIPIIVTTAKEELGELFRMEGVAGFFPKPFRAEDVIARVKAIIG